MPFRCSDPSLMRSHRLIHGERRFSCPNEKCDLKFKSLKAMKAHFNTRHQDKRAHQCEWPGCDKSFISPYLLLQHHNTHLNEKPYFCDYPDCNQRFSLRSCLLRHKKECHYQVKPFECSYTDCLMRFARNDDLNKHIQRVHLGIKIRSRREREPDIAPLHPPVLNPIGKVDKSTSTGSKLIRIRRFFDQPSEKRPYQCAFVGCGQVFAQLTSLRRHSKLHENRERFHCHISGCQSNFGRRDDLNKHLKKKHGLSHNDLPNQGTRASRGRKPNQEKNLLNLDNNNRVIHSNPLAQRILVTQRNPVSQGNSVAHRNPMSQSNSVIQTNLVQVIQNTAIQSNSVNNLPHGNMNPHGNYHGNI